ncbi:MAG: NAD-dependent epimerase/dehydratase family protein, partial [Planctomycetota bacterium]
MRVLVTGGLGFIGSHLVELLLARGHVVTALDDLSAGSPANLRSADGCPRLRTVIGSVLDADLVARVASGCDQIFHLASIVGVRRVLECPEAVERVCIEGTIHVLDAARRAGARVLVASSSEVYGRPKRFPVSETDPILFDVGAGGRWVYAHAKVQSEVLALKAHLRQGLSTVIARLFNTVGPRQSSRYGMVLPRFVQQACANEPLTVYGDGSQTRCFIDVRDVVLCLVKLAGDPAASGEVFNVGGTQEISIRELARTVAAMGGSRPPIPRRQGSCRLGRRAAGPLPGHRPGRARSFLLPV